MVKSITEGIQVSADARFEPSYSAPDEFRFIFSYQITIENQSSSPVQLLRRTWEIFDAAGEVRTVEGKGVVGEQPVIPPGETYTYRSACDLRSTYGRMFGNYLMVNKETQDLVHVIIPNFELATPWILN